MGGYWRCISKEKKIYVTKSKKKDMLELYWLYLNIKIWFIFFSDPEVCFRVPLDYHAGLVVQSDKSERILELLNNYVDQLSHWLYSSGATG
jgi:hypothetical protein